MSRKKHKGLEAGVSTTTTDPRKVTNPEYWEYALQRHITDLDKKKPRVHWDLRLGDPTRKIGHSWALPKGLPGPGEIKLAVQQPDHELSYFDFSGRIMPEKEMARYLRKGRRPPKNIIFSDYGAGRVYKEDRAKVEVLEANKDRIKFAIIHKRYQDTYLLFRDKGKRWYIKNISIVAKPKKQLVESKPPFKSLDPDKLAFPNPWHLMPKIDGSFATAIIEDKMIRVFSHRPRERTSEPIEYTARMPHISYKKPPRDLVNTVVRGEVIAYKKKGNDIVPFTATEVAQLLNSSPEKARVLQDKKGGKIEFWVFDVPVFKGKKIEDKPFHVREKVVEYVVKKLRKAGIGGVRPMPVARTEDEKAALWDDIKKGKYPYTKEGVVAVHPEKPDEWVKIKIRPTIDCKIVGTFPGKGRLKGKGIGGFLVIPEGSRTVTRVGTGLPDWMRLDAYVHPEKYIGKVVEVSVLDIFPEKGAPHRVGKLRAPALKKIEGKTPKELKFERFHIEKNL